MSDQTIHTPSEANGKPVMVGARGGLHTKDGLTGKTPSKSFGGPLATCTGPGYDIGFFKSTDSKHQYLVRYKGPKCDVILKKLDEQISKGVGLTEAINKTRLKE